jgi:protein subunit release factor A
MLSSNEHTLSVALASGMRVGAAFLADVVRMLECRAINVGVTLELVDRNDLSWVGLARSDRLTLEAFGREVGVHRAQLIPRGSKNGRVVTAKAVVSITSGGCPATSTTIVRTYNYPIGKVTVHATGESLDLAEVLAGRY